MTTMNTDELLSELDIAYKSIHKISNAIASKEGITHNPDYGYLTDKMSGFYNIASHVLGQLKLKHKEQKINTRKKHDKK